MVASDIIRNTRKYGATVNSHDIMKCLAVLLMTCDHIGIFFDADTMWWRVVGRWCVPIWFFFVGYAKPGKTDHTLYILTAFMVIADIILVQPIFPLNILATIILTRLAMQACMRNDNDLIAFMMVVFASLVLFPLTFRYVEYGSQVMPLALAGYYMRVMPDDWRSKAVLGIAIAIFTALQYFSFGMIPLEGGVMALGMIIIYYMLSRFALTTYNIAPHGLLSRGLRGIGRNTHYFYAFHYVAFILTQRITEGLDGWTIVWFAV